MSDDNTNINNNDGEAVSKNEAADNETNQQDKSKLSKNQLKKIQKWERKMEIKKRRKQQEKDAKAAKAKAQGRDLEQERKDMAERTAQGKGKERRLARWNEKMAQASSSFQICLDCSFEKDMSTKEINSLSQQLRYCYATNRKSSVPCHLTATSVAGETLKRLHNVSGFEHWETYGFACATDALDVHFKSKMANIVYLTSDSDNTIQDFENDKIYVIGGIVDRNRLKRAAITRAEALGVKTAKLPLDLHLKEMESTRVLTCNHVFDICLKYKECKNWQKALMDVLPSRKGATFEAATQKEESEYQKDASNPAQANDKTKDLA